MKKLLLFFTALIMLSSCSPEEENVDNPTTSPPPTSQNPGTLPVGTFNFTAETTTVLPYKIVTLSSNNQDFSNEIYIGKFGERDISLVKNPEGDLVFAIPDVESGNYSLKLAINGKEFGVNPSQISNASEVVKIELEAPLKVLKEDIDALISGGGTTANTIEQLNSANLMYSRFVDKLRDLSDNEKMDIAQFYKANPIFSSNINNANRTAERVADNSFSCFSANADMLATSTSILNDWEKVAIVINGTDAEGIKGAAVGAFVGGYLATSTVLASHERLTTTCTRPISSSLVDEAGNTDDFELTNNTFTNFQLKTVVRSLIASDTDDTNETVSRTVEDINQITDKWENTITSINSVTTDSSGWFNSWLPGNSEYESFSPLQSLPASGNESLLEGNNEYISITGLPSGVTAEVEKDEAGKLNIKFNAPENALPRNITGIIKYNDGIFNLENEFNVSLIAQARNYKLEIGYYNLDQTITTVKILSQGDEITLPNNMNRYIRLTLNDEPISAGPNNEGGWYNWTFGDLNPTPTSIEDIFIEDYEINLPDYLNGGISAIIKIDLTLSNQAFRHLLNTKYKITEYQNGSIRSGPILISYRPGGTMELTNLMDSSTYTRPYEFVFGHFSHEEQCLNYVFKTLNIGALRTGDYGIHGGPGFTYIFEDGNLRTNVFPYGCQDKDSGYLFERID